MKGDNQISLLEFIKEVLGCKYISDLRREPLNSRAKLLWSKLDLSHYSLYEICNASQYIFQK
jgi:hypothetical protein